MHSWILIFRLLIPVILFVFRKAFRKLQCIQTNLENAGLTCSAFEMNYALAASPLANMSDPALAMEARQCRGKFDQGSPVCSHSGRRLLFLNSFGGLLLLHS